MAMPISSCKSLLVLFEEIELLGIHFASSSIVSDGYSQATGGTLQTR